MHSSDQQPADEPQEPQESQPLYEFSQSSSPLNEALQPAPVTRVLPEVTQEPDSLHENIQQGFIYPPPPSFYQNIVVPPQPPVLPPRAQSTPENQLPNYGPQRQIQPGGIQAMYPPPGVPPYIPQPLAKKTYNKWAWIVISVLSVVILASCGLCGWGAYTLFATSFQQVSGSLEIVNDYYTDLQSQNYTAAYGDLAPQGQISGLTQKSFIQQATKLDEQYGLVVSFIPGQPYFSKDASGQPDLSLFTIPVNVKRTHLSYTVQLTVSKVRGNWKIINYDRL